MESDNQLIGCSWVAINLETMVSRAWSECFSEHPELKTDAFKQVIYVVIFHNICNASDCTPTRIAKVVANSFALNEKTVAARISRLIDVKLLELTPHAKDGRKKILRPTKKLTSCFGPFNEFIIGIVCALGEQIALHPNSFLEIQELKKSLKFNILDHVVSEEELAKESKGRA